MACIATICNPCTPSLATTYHQAGHYTCGVDEYDCESDLTYSPGVGGAPIPDCVWYLNSGDCGPVFLWWNGGEWVLVYGCMTGDKYLLGPSDPCDPTGSYTDIYGNTAVVS